MVLDLFRRQHHVVPPEGAEAAGVSRQSLTVPGVQRAVDALGRLVPFLDLPGGVLFPNGEELRIDRGIGDSLGVAVGEAHAQLFQDRPLRCVTRRRGAEDQGIPQALLIEAGDRLCRIVLLFKQKGGKIPVYRVLPDELIQVFRIRAGEGRQTEPVPRKDRRRGKELPHIVCTFL